MKSIVEMAHDFLQGALHPAALCIDATLGQGNDTRFFLSCRPAQVHAFDIQPDLCEKAMQTMTDKALHVYCTGHEHMQQVLQLPPGSVDAIVFNFGWNPAVPASLTTRTDTSVAAVRQGLTLLKKKGRMALVVYPHEEGKREKEALKQLLARQEGLEVMEIAMPFRQSPGCLLIQKQANWKGII